MVLVLWWDGVNVPHYDDVWHFEVRVQVQVLRVNWGRKGFCLYEERLRTVNNSLLACSLFKKDQWFKSFLLHHFPTTRYPHSCVLRIRAVEPQSGYHMQSRTIVDWLFHGWLVDTAQVSSCVCVGMFNFCWNCQINSISCCSDCDCSDIFGRGGYSRGVGLSTVLGRHQLVWLVFSRASCFREVKAVRSRYD